MFSTIKLRKHSAEKLDLCNLLITKFAHNKDYIKYNLYYEQILYILFIYQVNVFDVKNFNLNY
jgi:hypothetical protein